ncbi:hypothetical protein [Acinetobacter shaoyimingii]|uniref:Uncharacterized protein n=1 Tax=Acinetobacter shaoyimingii TaxID=2715164 RepID=A0A6G8RW57_9GAMM|nr:hypothetical protein [Acinetobacter shaoyimingii]NHB57277.1 hypothetical protein [Acinetobacter shaoyimingii]QIO06117.1 hypothetical protein G8E00_09190 [Acinetobacter shaoyimingii]
MMYQYHCGCCNKVVMSTDKVCSECGSQNIKSPYSLWLFCVFACLAVAIIFQMAHLVNTHQTDPVQQTLLDVLHKNDKSMNGS